MGVLQNQYKVGFGGWSFKFNNTICLRINWVAHFVDQQRTGYILSTSGGVKMWKYFRYLFDKRPVNPSKYIGTSYRYNWILIESRYFFLIHSPLLDFSAVCTWWASAAFLNLIWINFLLVWVVTNWIWAATWFLFRDLLVWSGIRWKMIHISLWHIAILH